MGHPGKVRRKVNKSRSARGKKQTTEKQKTTQLEDDDDDGDDDFVMSLLQSHVDNDDENEGHSADEEAQPSNDVVVEFISNSTPAKSESKSASKKPKLSQPRSLLDDDDDDDDDDEEDEHRDGEAQESLNDDADGGDGKSKKKKAKGASQPRRGTAGVEANSEQDDSTSVLGKSGKTPTGFTASTWKHSMLRLRDACDLARYDARFVDLNTEDAVEKIQGAAANARTKRFGKEQPAQGLASYIERECAPELPELMVSPSTPAQAAMAAADAAPSSSSNKSTRPCASLPVAALRPRIHPRLHLSREKYQPLQAQLFERFDAYRDVLFTARTFNNAKQLREMYVLHVLNHLFKARAYILRHTELLKSPSFDGDDDKCRDQGYTRPKALIVVPYRSHAVEIVRLIARMACMPTASGKRRDIRHKKRCVCHVSIGGVRGWEKGRGRRSTQRERVCVCVCVSE